jgi:hypothetical protein
MLDKQSFQFGETQIRHFHQNSQSVLAAYESALRSTAVRFLSREDSGSQFEPINADEQSQAETLQRKPIPQGARFQGVTKRSYFDDQTSKIALGTRPEFAQ